MIFVESIVLDETGRVGRTAAQRPAQPPSTADGIQRTPTPALFTDTQQYPAAPPAPAQPHQRQEHTYGTGHAASGASSPQEIGLQIIDLQTQYRRDQTYRSIQDLLATFESQKRSDLSIPTRWPAAVDSTVHEAIQTIACEGLRSIIFINATLAVEGDAPPDPSPG